MGDFLYSVQNDKPLAILLTTYNGASYIREQLESLYSQTYKDWNLYIHDDNSTDCTTDIIEEYKQKYNNIMIIEKGKHFGVGLGFLYLLNIVDSEYYAFCDQDDVWLKHKLQTAIEKLSETAPAIASCVVTDTTIVDSNLSILHESMWRSTNMIYKAHHPEMLQVCDIYTGCTMVFNRAAKNAISQNLIGSGLLHDQILSYSLFQKNGRFIIIDEPSLLYRQHAHNVHGFTSHGSPILYRIRNLFSLIRKDIKRMRFSKKIFGTSLFDFMKYRIIGLIHE